MARKKNPIRESWGGRVKKIKNRPSGVRRFSQKMIKGHMVTYYIKYHHSNKTHYWYAFSRGNWYRLYKD